MTESEKLNELRTMTDSRDDDGILSTYLRIARRKILNRMYPYGVIDGLNVPQKYESLQLEVAAYLLNKRGAEGETLHNENGVQRTYGGADVPSAMLAEITPLCAIPE